MSEKDINQIYSIGQFDHSDCVIFGLASVCSGCVGLSSLAQSQCEERETEQFRLENLAKKAEEDFNDAEVRRNTEYQLLKQEKDLEISTLSGNVLCFHSITRFLELFYSSQ